jgi:septal ring factor EnvC (AmiA/AmiB activator)
MPRNRLSLWATVGGACLVAGCTITEMRADNDRREQQVRNKELELQQEMQTQAQLQSERQRLLDDLRSRELTVDELKVRLAELQRLNAALLATTQEQQRQKAVREKQLSQAVSQVNGVEQDPALTPEAKARHLDDVRSQLRKMLELLANT